MYFLVFPLPSVFIEMLQLKTVSVLKLSGLVSLRGPKKNIQGTVFKLKAY